MGGVCSVEAARDPCFITRSPALWCLACRGRRGVVQESATVIGYSLRISTLPQRAIADLTTDDDGKAVPQPIDHDAVDVAFIEKASVAYYRAGGNWYRTITAD